VKPQPIVAFTTARTLLNIVQRMVYPFLPVLARGLGVETRTIELVVATRSGFGMLSPVISTSADRFGRRWAMLVAMMLFLAGVLTIFLVPTLFGFGLGLIIALFGKILFDPSMQAYISDRIPYAQRGRLLAITELGWSLSFIIGVPAAGWIIARSSWRGPFALFTVLAIALGLWLWRIIPSDAPDDTGEGNVGASLRRIVDSQRAWAGLGLGLLISLSNEMINIVFGTWLEGSFGLAVTGLGLAAGLIGIADLLGEGVVIGLVDRIGKRRLVVLALAANGVSSVALGPLARLGQPGALLGLFIFFFTFEITIVSSVPIISNLVEEARATMLGGFSAAASGGRMVGAIIGPVIFRAAPLGMPMLSNGVIAMLCNVMAIALVLGVLKEEQ
jgi:predicted MFS family arabinose efflux permease